MAKKQTRDRDKPTRRKPREQPELNRKTLHLLDDKFIYGVKKKDTYADGGNLYLQVGIGGSAKSWMFIYGAVRLLGEDSYTPFIAALEEAGQKIPPTAPDRIPALFKTANSIAKEYAAADEAYKQAVKAHEHAADAKRQGLLHVPVPAPGAPPHKTALIAAAEKFVADRRKRYVGLGSLDDVPPDAARKKAAECRAMLAEIPPRHPRDEFRRLKSEAAQRNVSTKRFKQMALDFLDSLAADPDFPIRSSTYNNHKGRLEKHLATLHDLYPAQITASEVFNIIQPLRIAGRRSTAHNCRKLIERVIEWAQGHGAFPKNEFNPAELSVGSPLHQLLRTKTTDPKPFSKPHKALHFSKTPALFARLQNIKRRTRFTLPEASRATNKGREYLYNLIRCGRLKATKPNTPYSSRSMDNWEVEPEDLFKVLRKEREVVPGLPSVALFALLFQILTASRPNESLGARWEEWKEEAAVLVVPWQRIKNGGRERKDFHVPLSPPATEILTMLREQQKRDEIWGTTPFVFGNYPSNNPTSGRIGIPPCLQTLRNLLGNNVENVDVDVTLHGFRTGFGSWGRRLGFLEHNVERALKHERGFGETYVARLYSRDAFNDLDGDPEILAAFGDDPLRGLLEAWAIYCVTGELPDIHKPAPVVPLIQRRANQRRL